MLKTKYMQEERIEQKREHMFSRASCNALAWRIRMRQNKYWRLSENRRMQQDIEAVSLQ